MKLTNWELTPGIVGTEYRPSLSVDLNDPSLDTVVSEIKSKLDCRPAIEEKINNLHAIADKADINDQGQKTISNIPTLEAISRPLCSVVLELSRLMDKLIKNDAFSNKLKDLEPIERPLIQGDIDTFHRLSLGDDLLVELDPWNIKGFFVYNKKTGVNVSAPLPEYIVPNNQWSAHLAYSNISPEAEANFPHWRGPYDDRIELHNNLGGRHIISTASYREDGIADGIDILSSLQPGEQGGILATGFRIQQSEV